MPERVVFMQYRFESRNTDVIDIVIAIGASLLGRLLSDPADVRHSTTVFPGLYWVQLEPYQAGDIQLQGQYPVSESQLQTAEEVHTCAMSAGTQSAESRGRD